jgi:hypothetical protein
LKSIFLRKNFDWKSDQATYLDRGHLTEILLISTGRAKVVDKKPTIFVGLTNHFYLEFMRKTITNYHWCDLK